MNLQPTLEGKLIALRPLKKEDFEALFQVSADPLLWEQHPQSDRYKREVFEKLFEGAVDSQSAFVVIDKSNNQIIGSSRYYNLDLNKKEITVGYTFLSRKYWGKKYNEEMKNLMLNYAFQFVGRVLFEVGECNIRSQRAMRKIGAKLIGSETLDQKSHFIFKIEKVDWRPL